MIWHKLKSDRDMWASSPYRVYCDTSGYSLWLYDVNKIGVIGRGFGSLKIAQDAAEVHKAKHAKEADHG